MERPLSSDSTTTAKSTTSGPRHQRHVSVKDSKRPGGASVVSLFVRNLRLLDLDLLPDWPNITVSSFSSQDARTRIKCTEYALYHLLRSYDSSTAADKLKPFFPPLEPLQSVNLRAALFRCLNDLKKKGVLSKDAVLRKSMLDDCQGDKLWDVCLNLSALVLRKVSLERKTKHGISVAEMTGTAQTLRTRQKDSMLPLAIVHKAALTKHLDKKQRKRETYSRLYDLLSEKDKELRQRNAMSQTQAQRKSALPPEKLAAVEQAVQKSWIGSTELKDALINGDTCAKGDGLLLESFDQLWQQDSDRVLTVSNGAEVGLLQDVNSRATQQSVRLSMWQNYLDRFVAARPPQSRASRPSSGTPKLASRFDRHQDLVLKDASSHKDDQPQHNLPRHRSAARYDEILTAMREELRKNSGSRDPAELKKPSIQLLKRAHTQTTPARNRSFDSDASPGATDPHSRSPSQTAVPVRPRLARRVTSQIKSYDKPKVDGQREPIPLKSELFSPLKENRHSTASLTPTSSALPSSAGDVESEHPRTRTSDKDVSLAAEECTSTGDGRSRIGGLPIRNDSSSAASPITVNEGLEAAATPGIEFKIPALPEKKLRDAKSVTRPSLAERTRMSIAFNSSEDVSGFLPDLPTSQSNDAGDTRDPAVVATSPLLNRPITLLERTRESISMAPTPQQDPMSKKPSHSRARSSIYPINQFDTPRKARSSTIGIHDTPKRDATPIEQLLSPDAEYDSVFKSRPKVALSPVLNPYRDAELNGSELLDLDVGASSTLVNVGGRS